MAARVRSKRFWSPLRRVLSGALRELPAQPQDEAAWAALHWELVVGPDLAAVTRIGRMAPQTLYVEVAGPEWRAPLKALEPRLLEAFNRRFGPFSRIEYRETADWDRPARPRPTRVAGPQAPPAETPAAAAATEGLTMIQDTDLRDTLARIARRLQFGLVGLSLTVLLANCASLPATQADSGGVPLGDSYAVKRIQELKLKQPSGSLHDPRAYYHFLMALKYERERDFDQAAVHYRQLVVHDPEREIFSQHLVELLLRTGQITDALDFARQTLNRFPKNISIRMILADILSVRGQHEEALAEYARVFAQDPKNSRAKLMMGDLLETQNQLRLATEAYREVTVIDPHNPLGFFYLGRALVLKGEFAEAETQLQKALNLRPSLREARKFLGRAMDGLGKFAQSLEQYQILNKLMAQKDLEEHIKQIQEKKRIADEGGDPGPVTPLPIEPVPLHALLGAMYYQQSAYLDALDEFRLALAEKDDLEIRWIVSKIYELLGRIDKAIQEIEAFHQDASDPQRVDTLLNLARLYGLNRQMENSVKLLQAALVREPRNDRLYHSLALAYMSLSNYDQAIQTIQKAIDLDDQRDAYFFELGALYERKGDYQRAVEAMERVLALNPNHSNAHNFIGYLYAMQGTHLDQALRHLQKALSIQPRNGYFLDSLGWIYFKKGDLQEALRQIKKAMIYVSPDPVLYDHLGEVHFSLRNFPEAHKAWKTSLALTLKKMDDPTGELPDPQKLQEKISRAQHLLSQPQP